MNLSNFFECTVNIIIGNGAGKFPFNTHETYTLRDLQKACLLPWQIRAYFKPRQVVDRRQKNY